MCSIHVYMYIQCTCTLYVHVQCTCVHENTSHTVCTCTVEYAGPSSFRARDFPLPSPATINSYASSPGQPTFSSPQISGYEYIHVYKYIVHCTCGITTQYKSQGSHLQRITSCLEWDVHVHVHVTFYALRLLCIIILLCVCVYIFVVYVNMYMYMYMYHWEIFPFFSFLISFSMLCGALCTRVFMFMYILRLDPAILCRCD